MTNRMKPNLSLFIVARAVSILGDRVAGVVLPLAVLAAGGSAVTAGLVGAASQLPQVVAALQLGTLVDRQDRRSLMVAADIVGAVSYVVLGAEIAFGGARLVPLLLLALVAGAGDAIFGTAAASYLPSVVERRELLRANGLVEGSDAAATLTGPAAGGWLLQALGPFVAFSVNAVSFAMSALLLRQLPPNRPTPADAGAEGASALAGLRLVMRAPQQRTLLIGACYMHLLAAAAFLPLLVRMREDLGFEAGVIGLVVSAAGIGGLLSSLLIARWCGSGRWPLLLAGVLGVNGGAVGVLALLDGPVELAFTVLVLDGASALAFTIVAATRQRITPDSLRGRVIAASAAVTATIRLLAVAAVGALIEVLGADVVLVALALGAVPFLLILVRASSDAEISGSEAPVDDVAHAGGSVTRTELK